MHSLFTPVDTLDTTTYLYSANHSNGSFDLEWLMPVTGLSDNGHSVTPPGFDSSYGPLVPEQIFGPMGISMINVQHAVPVKDHRRPAKIADHLLSGPEIIIRRSDVDEKTV